MPDRLGPVEDDAVASVVAVWADVLGETTINAEIGFFDLGATSFMVMEVVGRLRQRWPDLKVTDVFAYPTATALAVHLESHV